MESLWLSKLTYWRITSTTCPPNCSPPCLKTTLRARKENRNTISFGPPRTTNIWARAMATIPLYFRILLQAATAMSLCRVSSKVATPSRHAHATWPRCSPLRGYAMHKTILSMKRGLVARMYSIWSTSTSRGNTYGILLLTR